LVWVLLLSWLVCLAWGGLFFSSHSIVSVVLVLAVVVICVVLLVFPHCCRLFCCGVPTVYRIYAAIGFFAVAAAGALLLLTSLLLLVLPLLLMSLLLLASLQWQAFLHAVVRHFAVDNGGKFAAIFVDTGDKFSTGIKQRHRWQICHLCTGGAP
jgi:hypothetical protein